MVDEMKYQKLQREYDYRNTTPPAICEEEGHSWRYVGARDGIRFFQCRRCPATWEE